MLEIITANVIKKIVGLLFIEIFPKNSVIFDLLSPSILIFQSIINLLELVIM